MWGKMSFNKKIRLPTSGLESFLAQKTYRCNVPVANLEASPGGADGVATVAAVAAVAAVTADGDAAVRGATKPSPRKPPRHRAPRITIDLTIDLAKTHVSWMTICEVFMIGVLLFSLNKLIATVENRESFFAMDVINGISLT